MKYRTDFVTNSSSTSFAVAAASVVGGLLTALGLGCCAPEGPDVEGPEQATYSLQISPRSLRAQAGQAGSIAITVVKVSGDGEEVADKGLITLAAAGDGIAVAPDSGQGEMYATVEVAADAAPGTYQIAVTANVANRTLSGSVMVEVTPALELELTYPVGRSPKVFDSGWVFGARCIANAGTPDEQDLSEQVRWSGTGSFAPEVGGVSRPTFDAPGSNKITLTCETGGHKVSRTFVVDVVSAAGYAKAGDLAECLADAHGCPACPHRTVGPISAGSPQVWIDGKPAARVGDTGVHAACCGPNSFRIAAGDSDVLIEGRPAARIGDATQHCGGTGKIIGGAPGN
jgi:uncharacterized Zn-binding protein involved in type VI secretion